MEDFTPALGFKALTRYYDPVVRLTTREGTVKRALIDAARIPTASTVIDIGCGTGTLAVELKQSRPQTRVIALDADPDILERARKKALSAGTAVEFIRGNATTLPIPDDSVDRVVSSLFFHHLDRSEKRATMVEAIRVLRPGGEIHIADWGAPGSLLMASLFSMVRILDGLSCTEDNYAGRLPAMLQEAGAVRVSENATFSTVFGTIVLLQGTKPPEVARTRLTQDAATLRRARHLAGYFLA